MRLQMQKEFEFLQFPGRSFVNRIAFSVCDSQWKQLPLWCTYKQRGHSVDAVTPAAPLSLREAAVKRTSKTRTF